MIIYAKKEEVTEIIEKLEEIEENFWIQYKTRTQSNRDFLEDCFNDLYHKLYELIEGKQLIMEIKNDQE